MATEFGDLISEKRKKLGLKLREMAKDLGIVAPYLSDIEKGRRNPPNIEMLEKMAKILELTDDERDMMFDLAGKDRNEISPDLPDYLMETPQARTALRKARDKEIGDEFWEKISKKLDEQG